MIQNLMKKWIIDKKNSFMIGDNKKDKIAAKKVIYILNLQKKIFTLK